jgi:hypothetical protein
MKKIIYAGAAVVALGIAGCTTAVHTSSPATHSQTSTPPPATAPAPTHTTTPPPVTHTTPPAPPQYTVSQQQAITAAQNYLSDGSGFSEAGLIQQLTSSYGNGFSQADAEFAVNHVQVDWNQQAATAANGYVSSGEGFSCSSLLQQLTSPYGNQFTQPQAEFGVQSVGLGTC